jgi:hypothetical protein
MGALAWLLNGSVAVAVIGVAFFGAQGRTSAVVSSDPELVSLERRASEQVSALPALAAAYLERGQPGLAQSVLDRADANSADPELIHLRGRVAIARGEHEEAEHLQELTLATCAESLACPSWLEARAGRQLDMLKTARSSRSGATSPGGGLSRAPELAERRVLLAGL